MVLQAEEAGIAGVFTEVSGLDSENEIVEVRDGSNPMLIRKIPGRARYGDIVLKRGVVFSSRRHVESRSWPGLLPC